MFKRTLLGALTVAAGVGAALVIKLLMDSEREDFTDEEEDDEVHFIRIQDEEENDLADLVPEFYKEENEKDNFPQEVKEVMSVYPYLEGEFIQKLLNRNDEFNEKFPEDSLVTIAHATKFIDETTTSAFLDIMENAGYICSRVGLSVSATKKMFTQPGAIISDILNVANQANALEGAYLEYTVTK